jgi:hypothetical protein
VLEHVKNSDLRVYAVYVPILGGDDEASVPSAMKRLPDSRVMFYWDAKGELTHSYSGVLQLGEARPAWDVYLVFDRTAEWKAEPPAPKYWMHQLRGVSLERRLDGDALAAEIKKTLESGKL